MLSDSVRQAGQFILSTSDTLVSCHICKLYLSTSLLSGNINCDGILQKYFVMQSVIISMKSLFYIKNSFWNPQLKQLVQLFSMLGAVLFVNVLAVEWLDGRK